MSHRLTLSSPRPGGASPPAATARRAGDEHRGESPAVRLDPVRRRPRDARRAAVARPRACRRRAALTSGARLTRPPGPHDGTGGGACARRSHGSRHRRWSCWTTSRRPPGIRSSGSSRPSCCTCPRRCTSSWRAGGRRRCGWPASGRRARSPGSPPVIWPSLPTRSTGSTSTRLERRRSVRSSASAAAGRWLSGWRRRRCAGADRSTTTSCSSASSPPAPCSWTTWPRKCSPSSPTASAGCWRWPPTCRTCPTSCSSISGTTTSSAVPTASSSVGLFLEPVPGRRVTASLLGGAFLRRALPRPADDELRRAVEAFEATWRCRGALVLARRRSATRRWRPRSSNASSDRTGSWRALARALDVAERRRRATGPRRAPGRPRLPAWRLGRRPRQRTGAPSSSAIPARRDWPASAA